MTHTPGPWQLEEERGFSYTGADNGVDMNIVNADGAIVAQVFTAKADAVLIEAAPDLLEAAQRAALRLTWLREVALDAGATFDAHEDDGLASAQGALRAAIQKATGVTA